MHRLRVYWPMMATLGASVVFVFWLGQRKAGPALPDDWDIPRLAAYLNEHGLHLRVVPTAAHAPPDPTAYLTTTDKGWEEFNRLFKGPLQMDKWRGTLYCERGHGGDNWADLARQWGDYCLVAGPFIFFGDLELLGRVRAALTALS